MDDHSLHSPFVFNLFQQIISKTDSNIDQKIELLRKDLLSDNSKISLADFGAGSRVSAKKVRIVKDITKHSSTPPKFSALLNSLIAHFNFQTVIELGTSLGLNTLYLSKNQQVEVNTFEGDESLVQLAQKNFNAFNRSNIKVISGNIDHTLEESLDSITQVDLAYIDANHRYEPTIRYYKTILNKIHSKSLVVLDDIHWPKEMIQAWKEIKSRPEIIVSIDLFEGGLLFFDPELTPGEYVLKF